MRIPLGVIGMIYESRPNVTVDAAALCVKAGNAVILRGGSEALRSNLALAEELRARRATAACPRTRSAVIPTADRAAIDHLLREDALVDLIIPRGGPGLIRKVTETSRIPVIKHDAGVCHVFVTRAPTRRWRARSCSTRSCARWRCATGSRRCSCTRRSARVLPGVLKALHEAGVEIRGDAPHARAVRRRGARERVGLVEEYLAPILAVRVVEDLDAASRARAALRLVAHRRDRHESYASSQAWLRRVNSSTVGVNCSTAFADGFRLGLGAEIGSRPRSCTRSGRWGSKGSRRRSTSCAETASFANDADRRARRHLQPDPPRHLRAAEEVGEALDLSRVLLVPSAQPPHKSAAPLRSRRARCGSRGSRPRARAIRGSRERRRGRARRRVVHRRHAARARRERRRARPCSSSAATHSPSSASWREPKQLFALADFAVMARPGTPGRLADWIPDPLRGDFELDAGGDAARHRATGGSVRAVAIPALAISSSEIRDRVRRGRSIRYLVPEAVRRDIEASGVYAS
jgi:nicotinic acid mononucleotide adenylyltransferase